MLFVSISTQIALILLNLSKKNSSLVHCLYVFTFQSQFHIVPLFHPHYRDLVITIEWRVADPIPNFFHLYATLFGIPLGIPRQFLIYHRSA